MNYGLSCLQNALRQFVMVQPDLKVIMEMQLCRSGFTQYKTLAAKLSVLFRMIQTQVSTLPAAFHLYNNSLLESFVTKAK